MNSEPDDFQDLRRLLALKRHEKPPPGYFDSLPDRVMLRLEREDSLSEHSRWWEWLVAKLDAQPVVAGVYAFAVSGLMLLGFKLSQDLQHEAAFDGWLATTIDPNTVQPGATIRSQFANPAPLFYLAEFTSTEPVVSEPPSPVSYTIFPQPNGFAFGAH
jgi:hypothetical protein